MKFSDRFIYVESINKAKERGFNDRTFIYQLHSHDANLDCIPIIPTGCSCKNKDDQEIKFGKYFRLINENSGYYVHKDATPSNNISNVRSNVRMYDKLNDSCQLFYFKKVNEESFRIVHKETGHFIHISATDEVKLIMLKIIHVNYLVMIMEDL